MGGAGAVALALAIHGGVVGVAAVPDVVRAAAAACLLFTICGYAPARVLVRGELSAHRPLFVLPLGAACAGLELTLFGVLHVPLVASLAAVLVLSLLWAWREIVRGRRDGTAGPAVPEASERSVVVRVLLPLTLAALVGMISLVPIFRAGFVTIPGQNGDGMLFVGTAQFLEHAPPSATRPDLTVARVPVEWRSKLPVYYALAAVSKLSGQTPIATFATVSAFVLALCALGFFVFARYALRAPPLLALLALFVIPLVRIVMYVTVHPFYNELWAQMALPFVLLFGMRYLSLPSRRSAALFALFLGLALLVYPLLVPFPVLFLGTYAWVVHRRRRAAAEPTAWISGLHLPRPRQRPWLWIPLAIVGLPIALVLAQGVIEKIISALAVLPPGSNLASWHSAALPYLPYQRFFGMPESTVVGLVAVIVVCLLAWRGVSRLPGEVRAPMTVMVLCTAAAGVYFRVRTDGELFYFRDLAFMGPFVVLLALVELGSLARAVRPAVAVLGAGGCLIAALVVASSAGTELDGTFVQLDRPLMALAAWGRELPAGASIRIDVPKSTYQLWSTYMLHGHPLSALDPLGGPYPHPPRGRKADYIVAQDTQPRPADAMGAPLLANAGYRLWRMNPAVPGPDVSSRTLINDITVITF